MTKFHGYGFHGHSTHICKCWLRFTVSICSAWPYPTSHVYCMCTNLCPRVYPQHDKLTWGYTVVQFFGWTSVVVHVLNYCSHLPICVIWTCMLSLFSEQVKYSLFECVMCLTNNWYPFCQRIRYCRGHSYILKCRILNPTVKLSFGWVAHNSWSGELGGGLKKKKRK